MRKAVIVLVVLLLVLLVLGCTQNSIVNCGSDLTCFEKNRASCLPTISDAVISFDTNELYQASRTGILGAEGNCCKIKQGLEFHDSNKSKLFSDLNCEFVTYWKGNEEIIKSEIIYDQYQNCPEFISDVFPNVPNGSC
ncbi:MAG: hypothetical protein PHD05_09585 [Sphaerochaetaceae bacterium]|nr:hypothetical protein [Sphaerochaetaceae bacterium]